MCCPGCEAIAGNIVELGMESYYKHRQITASATSQGEIIPDFLQQQELWNEESIQQQYVRKISHPADASDGQQFRAITLMISGITCAACVWLIEKQLQTSTGISKSTVNLSSQLAEVEWDTTKTSLSDILHSIHKIGYRAEPYSPKKQETLIAKENKQALSRIAVAGLGTMQVMMLAGGLYLGAFQGIATEHAHFLRWVSAIICIPVYFFSGAPFIQGAIRNIRTRHAGMDIPISIAISAAFFASIWSVITHGQEVYFDSVCMFILFLSVGRYLEMRARHRSLISTIRLAHSTTLMATLIIDDGTQKNVLAEHLLPGDRVLIKPGDTIPGDGEIIQGTSSINESMLTGEELPVPKSIGSMVTGGTVNVEHPLTVIIQHSNKDSVLNALQLLLEKAQSHKPKITLLADKVSRYFVLSVLLVSIAVYLTWYSIEPSSAFWITLSVLVITCPCALSLATPAAITSSVSTLANLGFLTPNQRFSESLHKTTDIVFDKTGTLTSGDFRIADSYLYPNVGLTYETASNIAAQLESHSGHPIASAFTHLSTTNLSPPLENITTHNGLGIEAQQHNTHYFIGSFAFVTRHLNPKPIDEALEGQWVWLSSDENLLARFKIEDSLREDSPQLIDFLHSQNYQLHILSGDNSSHPQKIAHTLGIDRVISGASPSDKLNYIQSLQQQDKTVLMVGDGLNDAPVLAAANCSISMANGADLTKRAADGLLLNHKISALVDIFNIVYKTNTIIKQNLTWALAYNACALPAAALGWVPPWLAAIGMSTSSLIVVLNALRLKSSVTNNAEQGSS
ncbi:hypothetical protein A9Q99_20800 [Gammaproteobacteria bacterium 45_16_T64]|mgnify:CR=1 FL=1|nr:hypothetical protein A9Q99_20800 [Gammaproteobacteria bacterium 45_16_T64]